MASLPSTSSSSTASSLSHQITDRYYRTLYASLHDPRLATSSKQAMYLNLLFKSIKADAGVSVSSAPASGGRGGKGKESDVKSNDRIKALVRRFVQVLVSGTGGGGQVEFIAGGLYLLGELFSSVPGLRELINSAPDKDEEEVYDPKKRDPKYANAGASPLWELTPLLHHYHPTICLHTRQLLLSLPLTGASADLSQNTLSSFLDRFVYKNPKRLKTPKDGADGADGDDQEVMKAGTRGPSAMQPAASGVEGVKLKKGEVGVVVGKGGEEGRVNEGAFLRRRKEEVPVDQLFYYQYFKRKSEKEAGKKRKGKEDEEESDEEDGDEGDEESESEEDEEKEEKEDVDEAEDDEDASELDEDEVWKAMKASMPKAAGDDDADLMEDSDEDEDDDLPSDFDMSSEDEEDVLGEEDDEEMNVSDSGSDNSEDEEEDDDEEGLSLVEDSDNEDLLGLDEDIPDGLIAWDGTDDENDEGEDEEWGGIGGDTGAGAKRKRNDKEKEKEGRKERRKKLKSLPTFASYEDYQKMIEDGPEDNI